MKAGIFVADERMSVLSDLLKKDLDVILIDENDSMSELNQIAKRVDVLVFPPWGIDESGFVRMKERGIYVFDMLAHIKDSCVIFSGQESSFLSGLNQIVHFYMKDENVIKANAKLTAQGIMGYLFSSSKTAVDQMKVDLIGTGRCALACAELLDRCNIHYRYITRSQSQESGYIFYESWKASDPYDIIINTAPSTMVNQNVMNCWKNRKLVLDIATDFPFVEASCLKHPYLKLVKMKSIPAQVAPSKAAEIIAGFILKELKR